MLVTGIGGTGISTAGRRFSAWRPIWRGGEVTVLNQTGLAQKNGPVSSHVRIRPGSRRLRPPGRGAADVLLAADLLTTSDPRIDGAAQRRAYALDR